MRVTTLLLGLLTLAVGLTPLRAAPEEPPAKQAHPLYDDGGTLDWRTRIGDAMEVAKEHRRLIFVEWGRES